MSIEVTAFFTAILALVQIFFTMRVIKVRFKKNISLGDGGDSDLLKRIRSHANFTETVPIALLLLLLNELSGLSTTWLYALGSILVIARLSHYAGVALNVPILFRSAGMVATIGVIVVMAIMLLI